MHPHAWHRRASRSFPTSRFDTVECPTCHRDLVPESFSLSQQSQHSVEAHIESLKRDRQLISKNVQSLAARLGASQAEILNRDEELRHAERTLEAVNAAIGTIREQLVQAAANLATTERSMERVTQTVHELTALQEEVDAWRKEALESQRVGPGASDLDQRVGVFTGALRTYLLALGHSAVRPANVEGVRLDEDYVPQMETRRLRSLGSASDKPRVIAARYCQKLWISDRRDQAASFRSF